MPSLKLLQAFQVLARARLRPGLTLSPCLVRIDAVVSSFKAALAAPISYSLAEVAELADAHGSGPCTRKGVGVRVPSSAPLLLESCG
jgi:hypothetical protein